MSGANGALIGTHSLLTSHPEEQVYLGWIQEPFAVERLRNDSRLIFTGRSQRGGGAKRIVLGGQNVL